MRNSNGQFVPGPAYNKLPVGTIRIRTRHKRGGEQRAYIKVAEPNVWILNARHVWEQHYGPIPAGYGIHHCDLDKLNDAIENLELVSKSEHLDRHRPEYKDRTTATLIARRRQLRWSTKSKTKRNGRKTDWSEEQMALAIADATTPGIQESIASIARKHSVGKAALYKRLKRQQQ